jgi:hypothetical protein
MAERASLGEQPGSCPHLLGAWGGLRLWVPSSPAAEPREKSILAWHSTTAEEPQ